MQYKQGTKIDLFNFFPSFGHAESIRFFSTFSNSDLDGFPLTYNQGSGKLTFDVHNKMGYETEVSLFSYSN